MDYIVHGILQARILDWAVLPFSKGSSQPRDGTQVSHIAGGKSLGSLSLWKGTTEPIIAKVNSLFLVLIWLEL